MAPDPILIVDDNPRNRFALEVTLNDLPLNLVQAASGPEALRRLLDEDFALIIMDVRMPEMDGFETAELIRQRPRSQDTPIIFLTAFANDDVQVFKGYSLGAVDYLSKPVDADDVVAALLNHDGCKAELPANPMSADRVRWEHIQRVRYQWSHYGLEFAIGWIVSTTSTYGPS